jgi:hypothetical protein
LRPSSSKSIARWGALSAIAGGLLGVLITPVVAAAGYNWWDKPYYGWGEPVPPLVRPLRFMVEPMLSLPPANEVYPTFGRLFFFVFLLILLAVVALRALAKAEAGEYIDRRGKRGFRLASIGLVMSLFGNVADYWLGEEVLRQPLWGASFVIGTELGYLVYSAGSVLLGITMLRTRMLHAWSGWPLIIAPPLGILLLFWGIYHIPSGMVLPLSIAWLLVGCSLLLKPTGRPLQLETTHS